jgi:hypothetical protein
MVFGIIAKFPWELTAMRRINFGKQLFVFLMFYLANCMAGTTMVLEYKDVQFPKIHETKNKNLISLNISGLAFHSSLAVSNIKTQQEGSSLLVLVYLTQAREGLSGSFSYDLAVPDSVEEVRFGNEKMTIWTRQSATK